MTSGKAAFVAPLILVMALAPACSRQPNLLAPSSGPVSGRPLPFENPSVEGGNYPTASLSSSSLPPGTLLTVRMRSAVSSATCHAGDSFAALLAEPLVLEGQTVLAQGAEVTGRVVAAKASSQFDPGYLRLRLTGISLGGQPVGLETSSVFLKGGSRSVRGVAPSAKERFPGRSLRAWRRERAARPAPRRAQKTMWNSPRPGGSLSASPKPCPSATDLPLGRASRVVPFLPDLFALPNLVHPSQILVTNGLIRSGLDL